MVAGRKRKPGKRYLCGKRTKQQLEMDAMSTAIEARKRLFGVTTKQARTKGSAQPLGALPFASSSARNSTRQVSPSVSSTTHTRS